MDERIERYIEYLNDKKLELTMKLSEMDDSVEKTILLENYSKIYECEDWKLSYKSDWSLGIIFLGSFRFLSQQKLYFNERIFANESSNEDKIATV